MASQRVLLLTIAGDFADLIWNDICQWSNARIAVSANEWSPDDWSDSIRHQVDRFVVRLTTTGYLPPVLYRSEHVDCWSTGDVFATALVKGHPDYGRRLFTESHEIIATWVRYSEQIYPDEGSPPETVWLYTHINEAISARSSFSEKRLVLLLRCLSGGLWTDDEIFKSLHGIPLWWMETDRTGEIRERPAN